MKQHTVILTRIITDKFVLNLSVFHCHSNYILILINLILIYKQIMTIFVQCWRGIKVSFTTHPGIWQGTQVSLTTHPGIWQRTYMSLTTHSEMQVTERSTLSKYDENCMFIRCVLFIEQHAPEPRKMTWRGFCDR